MEAGAVANEVRISPRKCRLVVDLIRGKPVNSVLTMLEFYPKKAAYILKKLVQSALANAANLEDNADVDPDEFIITRIMVDEGPRYRRLRPLGRGRATILKKRTSHITVYVGLEED